MYCMPQEGTEAYLYFPEAEEESAYAVSEIHNSRCPVFADAQSRGLVTEHGKKMQLYADVLGFAGGKEETVQECRMGEDGIHFSAGKGKLQVTGSGQITFRAPEISLDAVQKIGQYKMESMAKEKAGRYGAEVMTLTVSGGLGLIPVGGTVVTLPQLAGAFQLVAGIVTSQNLLFQMEEVLMFCTSGKEMGAPTGNWLYDSARDLTEMASMQFAVYGLMNPYTYQRPKITPLPNETGLTVPGGTGVAVVPNGTAPALNPPYLPEQYTEYPAAVQGWAQQALPGGGSGIESGLNSNLLDELANSGVKYNPEDIVAITKTADGKLVWLENGTDTAGLNHIITEHADDFLNKGITQEQIPDYVMNALENGKIVGYQGRGTGRPIYEFTYNGEIHKVAITVGNNGFIVGANPK